MISFDTIILGGRKGNLFCFASHFMDKNADAKKTYG